MFKFILPLLLICSTAGAQSYFKGFNLFEVPTTTATSASTTTLTCASKKIQEFTGVTTQTIVLPSATASGCNNGLAYYITNRSTGTLTIEYHDTTTALTLIAGNQAYFSLVSNGTSNGSWDIGGTQAPLTFTVPLVNTSDVVTCNVASGSQPGCLSSADWTTFNNKQPAGNYITALTGDVTASGPGSVAATLATVNANVGSFTNSAITVNGKGLITAAASGVTGNLTDAGTDGITVTSGTGAVLGSGTSLAQHVADTTHNGYLLSTDWNTFNGKQAALNFTAPLVNTTNTITCNVASGSQPGCLSSADWTTFNGKTSGGITALTGGVTASGPGSATATVVTNANMTGDVTSVGNATTLATVNSNTGSCGDATHVCQVTLNGKGLATAASAVAITATGTVTSVAATVPSVLSISGSPITTSGTLAIGYSGTALPVANGGTGLTSGTSGGILGYTATGTLASSSLLAANQVVIGGGAGATPTTLAAGTTAQVLGVVGSTPTYIGLSGNTAVLKTPTIQTFTSTGTQTGWLFTVSSWTGTIVAGDTYTNNGHTYTAQMITQTNGTGQTLFMTGPGGTSGSTLTKSSSASGPATITFSAEVATATYTTPTNPSPLYLGIKIVGGGGGGGGGGTGSPVNGSTGTNSYFGPNILTANAGLGGANNGAGGTGGTASIGTATGNCNSGGYGGPPSDGSTSGFGAGGIGGVNIFGGAGTGQLAQAGVVAIANTGAGGGGGGGSGLNSYPGAGGGASGFCDVLITSPASTYPYVIGGGGAGGAAGTGGAAGAAGATGYIEVIEHFQ